MTETREIMERLYLEIADVAKESPVLVVLAILEELIVIACGTNPALKEHMRMRFYQHIVDRLAKSRAP